MCLEFDYMIAKMRNARNKKRGLPSRGKGLVIRFENGQVVGREKR
ncbi:MAG TPA: hypothetical protein VFF13_01835 [archaeon]|nr:hypothetical protein [archaeon]